MNLMKKKLLATWLSKCKQEISRWEQNFWAWVKNNPELRFLVEGEKGWHILEAFLTLFLLLFLLIFALRPTVLAISQLMGEIKARQHLSRRMEHKINDLTQAQSVYFDFENNIALLDAYYPEGLHFKQGALQLLGEALENNLEIEGISLKGWQLPKKTTIDGKLGFHLSVKGQYEDIKNFLKGLYQVRRAIWVETYTLAPAKTRLGEANKSLLELNIDGYFLFFSPTSGNSKTRR